MRAADGALEVSLPQTDNDQKRGQLSLCWPTCLRRSLTAWLEKDMRSQIGDDPPAGDFSRPRYFLHGWSTPLALSASEPAFELCTTHASSAFWASTLASTYALAQRLSSGTQFIELVTRSDARQGAAAWPADSDEGYRGLASGMSTCSRSLTRRPSTRRLAPHASSPSVQSSEPITSSRRTWTRGIVAGSARASATGTPPSPGRRRRSQMPSYMYSRLEAIQASGLRVKHAYRIPACRQRHWRWGRGLQIGLWARRWALQC